MKNGKPLPPVWFLLALAASALLHYQWPVAELLVPPLTYAGAVLIAIGVVVTATAAGAFARAGTPLVPFETSTVVVTGGLYRYTRNPMYLGMVIALFGAATWFGTFASVLPIPLFIWVIQRQYIVPEEAFLEELFGAEYLAYKQSVRRWL